MKDSRLSRVAAIVLATEPYLISSRSSIMAAKLLSMRLGVDLKIVNSGWLVSRGFKPYVPCFLAEFKEGDVIQIRKEENLDHREMADILEDDLRALCSLKHQDNGS